MQEAEAPAAGASGARADGAGLADDLHALEAAPTFGLNARELILRAAAAADDDDDDLAFAPVGAAPAAAAADRRAAAVAAGRALAAAWPQAEKPFPDLIKNAKVPRSDRVPVLARLAGEHLALALDARLGGRVDWARPPAALMALSTAGERAAATAAAKAQERGLYASATGGGAYRARAGRASAVEATDSARAPAPPPPRPRKPQPRSRPAPDPVLARRAAPDPRPPPRKRAREEEADVTVAAPSAGLAWTADPAAATDPAAAAAASEVGRELAALLKDAVQPLVSSGECRQDAADAGAASALRKVLASHAADALSGRRDFIGQRKDKLADFAVACARTAESRAVRADKAARADRAARWGAEAARK